jgi:SM-20-related protein
VSGLARDGYSFITGALPVSLINQLLLDSRRIGDDRFERAGIGRASDHHLNRFIRGDQIFWPRDDEPVIREYLAWIEQLRLTLNQRLFLGLFDYECHYACYPRGAFYRRHVDAFHGDTNRVLSTVLYLNPNWGGADGGQLVLYRGDDTEPCLTLAPTLGTLAVFLSEDFPHQVLPTTRPRYSLTGWFRVNGSVGRVVDPPR